MGNCQCLQQSTSMYKQWHIINRVSQFSSSEYLLLSSDYHSDIFIEKWMTSTISKKMIYQNRKKFHMPHMIEIYEYGSEEAKSGKYKISFIVTERLIRLNELTLAPVDAYALLYECLQGFDKLMEYFGQFEITEQMIMINKKRNVKLWINHNLAQNRPEKIIQIDDQGRTVKSRFLSSQSWSSHIKSLNVYHSKEQLNETFGCMIKQLLILINKRVNKQLQIQINLNKNKQQIKKQLQKQIFEINRKNCLIRLYTRNNYNNNNRQKINKNYIIENKKNLIQQSNLKIIQQQQSKRKQLILIEQSLQISKLKSKQFQIHNNNNNNIYQHLNTPINNQLKNNQYRQQQQIKFCYVSQQKNQLKSNNPPPFIQKKKLKKMASTEKYNQVKQNQQNQRNICPVQLVQSRIIVYQQQ